MKQQIAYFIFTVIITLSMSACGGGGNGAGGENLPGGAQDISGPTSQTGDSVTIATQSYQDQNSTNPNEIVIKPSSSSVKINAINPIEVNSSMVVSKSESEVILGSEFPLEEGSPLFIGGVYAGVISSYSTNNDDTVTVALRPARELSEIIDSFSLSVDTTAALPTQSKSARKTTKTIRGASPYDKYNTKKIAYTITSSKTSEPVLRISIPEGYKIPTKSEKINCDLLDASCDIDASGQGTGRIDLGDSVEEGGILFSTEGSYLEVGLGITLDLFADINIATASTFKFTLKESAYLESSLQTETTGSLSNDWAKEVPFTKEISIKIPVAAGVFVTLGLKPYLTLGANGEIEGKIRITSYNLRKGETVFNFDSELSQSDKVKTSKSIKFDATAVDKNGVSAEVEASSEAFVTAGVQATPSVSVANLMDIDIVKIRGGVHTSAKVEGSIGAGFEVVNKENSSELDASASFSISAYPKVEYLLDVAIKPVSLDKISFYRDTEYGLLYKGETLSIFDWEVRLLNTPTIKKQPSQDGGLVSFDISAPIDIRQYIKFYYTKDGTEPMENTALLWDLQPINVTEPTIIKVKAVLEASDYITSIWSFGRSVSFVNSEFIDPEIPDKDNNITAADYPAADYPDTGIESNNTIPEIVCPLTEDEAINLLGRKVYGKYTFTSPEGTGVACIYSFDGMSAQYNYLTGQTPLVGHLIHGMVVGYHTYGGIFVLTPYVNNMREGVEEYFELDGSISHRTQYSNDLVNGIAVRYYTPSGVVALLDTYSNGIANGPHRSYYSSGQVHGQTEFVNGETGEEYIYYEDGSLQAYCLYPTGERANCTYY